MNLEEIEWNIVDQINLAQNYSNEIPGSWNKSDFLSTRAQMIIQICIREVLGSNLARDSGYTEPIFINLSSCWQIDEYSTISE